jgi:hypothetical protein
VESEWPKFEGKFKEMLRVNHSVDEEFEKEILNPTLKCVVLLLTNVTTNNGKVTLEKFGRLLHFFGPLPLLQNSEEGQETLKKILNMCSKQ